MAALPGRVRALKRWPAGFTIGLGLPPASVNLARLLSCLPVVPNSWPVCLFARSRQDLKFGTVFTDHMFHCEHVAGQGWGAPAVKPLGLLQLHPAAQVGPSNPGLLRC